MIRRLARTVLPVLFLVILTASCLKPTEFEFDPSTLPVAPPASETPPGPAEPIHISTAGIVPATGVTPERTISSTKFIGVITWAPSPKNNQFEPFKDYSATIDLAVKQGVSLPPAGTDVTVEGALSAAYDADAGTITARFPRTYYPVDSVSGLNTAIGNLSSLPIPNEPNNKNVIELTADFYNAVNTASSPSFITIGASETDNNIPYTIRGLGKDSQALNVGILLANNNVTLEDVRIDITTSSMGVPKRWTTTLNYRAALIIGRSRSAPSLGSETLVNNGVSKNVTIRNCTINFKASDSMIAGIMVLGLQSPTEHISIIDNEVTVDTTSSSYAAQALLIYSYTPTLQITGNGIEAINIATNHTKPASALFMQINPSFIGNFGDTPLISGNTINGNPAYDFYINIMSHGNRIGVQEMLANGFATPASTWMAAASTDTGDTRSFYKRLIETLLPQIRTGSGYGYLAMYLNNGDDCVFEAYERRNSRLYAIDFWGYTIDKGAYTSKEVRARLLLNSAGEVAKNVEQFHWTYTITDTNIPALP